MRSHAPLEAAVAEHPLDLVGEQDQGRQRGRVVGLLLARVLQRRLQREEGGLPAVAGAVELLDAGDRGRAQQRQPEAAVGAEGLLRGEVVGVGLGDVDRQAAGAGGGVDQDQRLAGALGPAHVDHHPGRGLVVGPGEDVGGGVGGRLRRVAGLGLDHDRVGEERRRRGRLGELLRELAVGEVQGALAHQPGGGGLPEGGGAAVAEDDLVAVGQREQLGRGRRGRARPGRAPAPGGARCPSASARSASAASASGRTFEGPQPKRPSAGFSSAGIWVGLGGLRRHRVDRLLTGAGGLRAGAAG